MPQPYNGGYSWGPDTLLERPAIAIKMALVSANWALVEYELELHYAFFMSKWTGLLPGSGFVPTHPVAQLTFNTLQTLNTKLDLLRALGEWVLTPEEFGEMRDTHIPRIRQRA